MLPFPLNFLSTMFLLLTVSQFSEKLASETEVRTEPLTITDTLFLNEICTDSSAVKTCSDILLFKICENIYLQMKADAI